jgi:anti-sigma regulatory factor (Ser/Thr protein kinase)
MNATTAYPVTDVSQVAEPRRAAQWIASRLGFSEERAGSAALIVSELATNLAKHARSGEVLVRPLPTADGDYDGLEILALDKGPGMPDVALSQRDGYSTSGTLGHGLGAISRQADWLDVYSHPSGTAIAARLWREQEREHAPSNRGESPLEVSAVQVAKTGESVCGDAWSWRWRSGRLALFVADGLGHGLAAHEAAESAVRVFAGAPESRPGRLIEDVHAALRPTRGAAVASLAIDLDRGVGTFAGLGNITATVVLAGVGRHKMVSHNGTAGHTAARIQEFSYPVPPGAMIVMCSDGLGTHWDLQSYPGLSTHSAPIVAGVLYRDFSRRRDDVTVVVARERTPLAEKV